MWKETPTSEPEPDAISPPASALLTPSKRSGDVAAMLRVMRPLTGEVADPILRRRRLLADLCRLVGVSIGALDRQSIDAGHSTQPAAPGREAAAGEPGTGATSETGLSPRMEQTLHHLLDGASEKEVARKLSLSKHTVHVYVKALYRRFGVSSRAELLAKHVKR